jgi:uncharacterized tellurite resistance protein B-like protein
MRRILSFLGLTDSEDHGDVIGRIAGELEQLGPERARYVASFAFVLSRIANADHHVRPDEVAAMERLVVERAGLPPDQAALVVEMATTEQGLFGATNDFLVTRELASLASHDEKLGLVDCLYAVAAADHHVRPAEADEISRIGRELRLETADLAGLRHKYRDKLSVRRGFAD